MHQGPRTEAVASLLEREALTALPKASVNLHRQNGVGDVWQIPHCLSSNFGRRLRRGLVLGETGEKPGKREDHLPFRLNELSSQVKPVAYSQA